MGRCFGLSVSTDILLISKVFTSFNLFMKCVFFFLCHFLLLDFPFWIYLFNSIFIYLFFIGRKLELHTEIKNISLTDVDDSFANSPNCFLITVTLEDTQENTVFTLSCKEAEEKRSFLKNCRVCFGLFVEIMILLSFFPSSLLLYYIYSIGNYKRLPKTKIFTKQSWPYCEFRISEQNVSEWFPPSKTNRWSINK